MRRVPCKKKNFSKSKKVVQKNYGRESYEKIERPLFRLEESEADTDGEEKKQIGYPVESGDYHKWLLHRNSETVGSHKIANGRNKEEEC